MSVLRPVRCNAPCEKLWVVAARRAPRPTCDGLVPATTPLGSPAVSVWLNTSENTTFDALKPEVDTFEMSFEITSSMSWWFFIPEMALDMERIMVTSLFW